MPSGPPAKSRAPSDSSAKFRSPGDSSAKPPDCPADAPVTRALRPPLRAEVHAPHGSPERIRSALANGEVLHCAGPWRTTGAWWSTEERFAFDHFDIATSDGHVFRLRRDLIRSLWEIDAVYD